MHDQFRMCKHGLSCAVHQPTDVIGMRVGQQDGVDRSGFDAGKHQVRFELATPLLEPARPTVDENGAAAPRTT